MTSGKGEQKMNPAAIPRYNVRDTKRYYSELNSLVLKGMEVITYNANNKGEVSHIKTSYLDSLLEHLHFKPETEHDDELQVYTVSLSEIDIYGEGKTVDEAVDDLVNSIIEFLVIYTEKIDIFSKVEPEMKQLYLLKLLRCNGDKDKIKKAIGF